MKKFYWIYMVFIFITGLIFNNNIYAVEPQSKINNQLQSHSLEMMIIERLARIEEGQKSIINEMRTRFEAVDQRFLAVDQRFLAIDKRFDAVDQRFESVLREMNERFEAMDKRIDQLNIYFLAMIGIFISMFLAIMGYAIWDRRTFIEKIREETLQVIKENQREYQSVSLNVQEKFQMVIDIMKKMSDSRPDMRNMMKAAQLL